MICAPSLARKVKHLARPSKLRAALPLYLSTVASEIPMADRCFRGGIKASVYAGINMLSVRGIRGRILSNSTSRASLARRVTQAYVGLSSVRESDAGTRIVSLARCGDLEIRLIEFARSTHDGEPPLWVDLYDHTLAVTIDSCRCNDLDEAVSAAEHLHSEAQSAAGRKFSDGKDENE
jgi:hypothetical protein